MTSACERATGGLPAEDIIQAIRWVGRGTCHDVKGFLGAVSLYAGMGLSDERGAPECLRRIQEACAELGARLEPASRYFAGRIATKGATVAADLALIAGMAADLVESVVERAGASAVRDLAPAPAAIEPGAALDVALALLVAGALESRGGVLRVATRAAGPLAELEVVASPGEWEGAGAEPPAGLASFSGASAIIAAAGGRLDVERRPRGLAVRVEIPAPA
jgi:hypothetical protein